jgi:hypothetical protein
MRRGAQCRMRRRWELCDRHPDTDEYADEFRNGKRYADTHSHAHAWAK